MTKITIKLPTKDQYWRLKATNRPMRRYLSAANLLGGIQRVLLASRTGEKIAIVVKRYMDTTREILNESLASNNKEYLLYAATCFLEDYLSPVILKRAEKKWSKWVKEGGAEV